MSDDTLFDDVYELFELIGRYERVCPSLFNMNIYFVIL
jgi:hypothetical protein